MLNVSRICRRTQDAICSRSKTQSHLGQSAAGRTIGKILQILVRHIPAIFDCKVVALLTEEKGKLKVAAGDFSSVIQKDVVKELRVARSACEAGQIVCGGRKISPSNQNLYIPLRATDSTLGILVLKPTDPEHFFSPERLDLLEYLILAVA